MLKKYCLLLAFIFMLDNLSAQVLTLGPMLHCYIGAKKPKVTIGFEAAVYLGNYSIDFGIEGGKHISHIYSELQYAKFNNYLFISGLSLGVYKRIDKDKGNCFGFQSTLWGYYYGGADLRFRIDKSSKTVGLGGFVKGALPFYRFGT